MKRDEGQCSQCERSDSIGYNMRDIRRNSRSSKYTVRYVVSEINRSLPDRLRITEGLYYKWESEERMPTARHIPAIANALGVSEAALFHWQDRKKRLRDDNIEKLFEGILALGDDKIGISPMILIWFLLA